MTTRRTLCVISWNISEKHASLDSIEQLIAEHNSQSNLVLCLQEVPRYMLIKLEVLAQRHAFTFNQALDKRRLQADGKTRDCYLVVLSQFPILGAGEWQISDTSKRPLLTNVAIWFLRKAGKWDDTAIASNALCLDLNVEGQPVRLFNAHLSLTSPTIRRMEFQSLLTKYKHTCPMIFAGDFNILEGLFGRAVNFLIGGSIPYALWRSERKEFDSFLENEKLTNPLYLYKQKTHKAGQLDHVVYSRGLNHREWKVLSKQRSDHNPVRVTLELL